MSRYHSKSLSSRRKIQELEFEERLKKSSQEYEKLYFSEYENDLAQIPDYLKKYISYKPLTGFPDGYFFSFIFIPFYGFDSKPPMPMFLEYGYCPEECSRSLWVNLEKCPEECRRYLWEKLEKLQDRFYIDKPSLAIKYMEIDDTIEKLYQFKKEYTEKRLQIQKDVISGWLVDQIGKSADETVRDYLARLRWTQCAGVCYGIQYTGCPHHCGTYSKQDFFYNLPTIYEFYAMLVCQTKFEMKPTYERWGN